MGQPGHLGARYPNLPVASMPGCSLKSPRFVPRAAAPSVSEATVQLSTGPSQQLRQEEGAGAAGWGCRGCSPCSSPGCQSWSRQVRVAGAAGMARLSHSLFPIARPALLGQEGLGSQQPRVRTSPCQSQLLAAIWAEAAPVSQICLPFGKGGDSVLGR
jgi:hypothetical protein